MSCLILDANLSIFNIFKTKLTMGNSQLIMGKYISEKKPNESRVLRNTLIPDDAQLIDHFNGMKTVAEIFRYKLFLIKIH